MKALVVCKEVQGTHSKAQVFKGTTKWKGQEDPSVRAQEELRRKGPR